MPESERESNGRHLYLFQEKVLTGFILVFILTLAACADAYLMSALAPYLVLYGPTPADSITGMLPVILSGTILILSAANLMQTRPASRRIFLFVPAGLKLFFSWMALTGNLPLDMTASFLFANLFLTALIYLSLFTTNNKRMFFYALLALEFSKGLYFTILTIKEFEIPLEKSLTGTSVAYLILFAAVF